MIKTSEDYNNLSTGLSNVRQAVNELIEAGFILVNGRKVARQFYLGGEYKVEVSQTDFFHRSVRDH